MRGEQGVRAAERASALSIKRHFQREVRRLQTRRWKPVAVVIAVTLFAAAVDVDMAQTTDGRDQIIAMIKRTCVSIVFSFFSFMSRLD